MPLNQELQSKKVKDLSQLSLGVRNTGSQKTPTNIQELFMIADQIAGENIECLIDAQHSQSQHLSYQPKHKGWQGEVIEKALRIDNPSQSGPDFLHLGVEVKSIPIREDGLIFESTYICRVPQVDFGSYQWVESRAWSKMKRILWVPVLRKESSPSLKDRIGYPFLWCPTPEQESILREDWESHINALYHGVRDALSATRGTWLQVRPKGRKASDQVEIVLANGNAQSVQSAGFYLRPSLTKTLVTQSLGSPEELKTFGLSRGSHASP